MITLSYHCTCGWESWVLDDAQEHSNTTSHHVQVSGFLTPTLKAAPKKAIADSARTKAYEAQVLRIAKEKGLIR